MVSVLLLRRNMLLRSMVLGFVVLVLLVVGSVANRAEAAQLALPGIDIEVDSAEDSQATGTGVRLLLLLTVLAVAPALLIMLTSFTRIIIVLSFVRTALATQQMPPNQVLIGLAVFMTIFVMAPVWGPVYSDVWIPFRDGEMGIEEAYEAAMEPFHEFMMQFTRERDLDLFLQFSGAERPDEPEGVPMYALVPAFAISEMKTAFQMGFVIFLPFIVIDMVVASTLMSMGMLMLPPMMISLPFKILLFVMVDGWHLVIKSLLEGLA